MSGEIECVGDVVTKASGGLMLEGDGGATDVNLVGVDGSDSSFCEGRIISGFVKVGDGSPSDDTEGFFVCRAVTAGCA